MTIPQSPAESTAPPVAVHKLLTGQKALVTGANSGIGKGSRSRWGRPAPMSSSTMSTTMPPPTPWSTEIEKSGAKAYAHKADVSSEEQVAAMFARMIAGIRHDRHSRQQCRPAAGFGISRHDTGEMEQGSQRQPDRAIPVRARGGAGIPAPRRRSVGIERRRQDHLHEFGSSGDSMGRPCQLRHVQGRHQTDDGKHGAGTRAEADSRQRHRAGRDPDADQHRRLADQGGLRRS